MSGRMVVVPVTRDQAMAYVGLHHRHSRPPQGYRAAIAAAVGEQVVGVAIVGRPVNRSLDDGWTLEVLRCCTQGHPNANSFLYGAAWRLVRALGYRRAVTYTLKTESGTSLRAAGWARTCPEAIEVAEVLAEVAIDAAAPVLERLYHQRRRDGGR